MKKNLIILIPIFILELLSIIYLKNAYQIKQLIWFIFASFSFFIITNLKEKYLKIISIFLYLLSIILLIIVLFHPYTNGSRGWLKLSKISIQPSEITKISLILVSYYLANKGFKSKILYILIFLIPSILTFIEPDTGAVIIYLIIFIYFLPQFFSKKEISLMLIFLLLSSIFLVYLYLYKKDTFIDIFSTSIYYRLDRITSFKNQDNMQVNNALISLASGRLLYFPEANNDFFFAYLLSKNPYNFGIIIWCYLIIFLHLIFYNNSISHLIFFILAFQVVENMGMNLNLLPVIGIPLPFLSYGGSHTITTFLMLGLARRKLSSNHNKN